MCLCVVFFAPGMVEIGTRSTQRAATRGSARAMQAPCPASTSTDVASITRACTHTFGAFSSAAHCHVPAHACGPRRCTAGGARTLVEGCTMHATHAHATQLSLAQAQPRPPAAQGQHRAARKNEHTHLLYLRVRARAQTVRPARAQRRPLAAVAAVAAV